MHFICLFWFMPINLIVLGPVPVNPQTTAEMLSTIFQINYFSTYGVSQKTSIQLDLKYNIKNLIQIHLGFIEEKVKIQAMTV